MRADRSLPNVRDYRRYWKAQILFAEEAEHRFANVRSA